jgi:pimeloyl-ACP methyl ester carboxylesterase
MQSTEALWRPLYPFQSHFLQLPAGRYHYLDEGSGEPLLMIHGNPTWSFHWRNLILGLRTSHRIVAPDHLGCGLSEKPASFDYRLASHIENLMQLVAELDLHGVTLVAQDWGGAIGLGAALRMPERFARIILFNTGAFRSSRMPWRIRICRTPGVGPILVRGLNGFARAALNMAIEHPERLTAAARAGYLFPYDSWKNRIAIDRFVNDIPMNPGHPSYAKLVEIERGLSTLADRPVQLIWGMRDWCFTPQFLDRFTEFFPSAEVHRIADAGHWVVEDAHEQILPIVKRFLSACEK